MAAPSGFIKNFIGGSVRGSDGTGTPVTLVLPLEMGNFAVSGLQAVLNEPQKLETRGQFRCLQRGNRIYPQFSLSAYVGNVVGGSTSAPGGILEMLFGKGAYAANVSTLGANRYYVCDIRLTIEGTTWGDGADETIDLEDVLITIDFAEAGEGNTISITGEVLGAVVITNSTNTVTLAQAA